MTLTSLTPARTLNLVAPLAHKATAMHITDTAMNLVAACTHSTRARCKKHQHLPAADALEYTSPVPKGIQDWRPVAPAAKAALTESAAFCFGARFMAAHSGSRKTRRFRSAGARYANLIGLPPRLASWEAVITTAPTEAIMADIITNPRAQSERVIQTRIRGRLPKSVPSLYNVRRDRRFAAYEAQCLQDEITTTQNALAALERAGSNMRMELARMQQQARRVQP